MIKDLIVNLERAPSRQHIVNYAISVSERFDAHVTGVAFAARSGVAAAAMGEVPADIIRMMVEEDKRMAQDAIGGFETAARRSNISAEPHLVNGTLAVDRATTFARMTRRFDLSVIMQSDSDHVSNDDLIEAALFESGRPVIVVPYIHRNGINLDRIVCCWDGSRTAARAVNDAIPLLKQAKSVELLRVTDENSDDIRGFDIANHLARHGLKVDLNVVPAAGIDIANRILSHAADVSADMLVMGGYGHSRLREFLLGGVTRGILGSMTVPTFMSH
jgi:nucleotide-binding universal stress UspA family protein